MNITKIKQNREGGYKLNDDMFVPRDPANRHYQMIREWIAVGNTPDPPDPEPVVGKEAEERETLIQAKVREMALQELIAEGKLTADEQIIKEP